MGLAALFLSSLTIIFAIYFFVINASYFGTFFAVKRWIKLTDLKYKKSTINNLNQKLQNPGDLFIIDNTLRTFHRLQ